MLASDEERLRAGIDGLALRREHSSAEGYAALRDKERLTSEIDDLDTEIANAGDEGNHERREELEAKRDELHDQHDAASAIVHGASRLTVDDISGKTIKGGKGYAASRWAASTASASAHHL